jgi:undecaprenyl-diphosphatase
VAGDFRPVLAVAAVVGLGLLATFRFRPALILGLVTLAAVLLSDYSKNWVHRSRPDVPGQKQRADDGSSFPSGHALRTGAVFVTAAWLLARRTSRPWQARSLLGATGLLVFLIGFSRMWLGVHWVSDVLGGWAAGLGLAFLARWADGVGAKCPARPGPALLPPA